MSPNCFSPSLTSYQVGLARFVASFRITTLSLAILATLSAVLASQDNSSIQGSKETTSPDSSPLTWPAVDLERIKTETERFLTEQAASNNVLAEVQQMGEEPVSHSSFVAWLEAIPATETVLDRIAATNDPHELKLSQINSDVIKNHLLLEYSMSLVRNQLHDEALSVLQQIDQTLLVQPGLAIVFQSICHHQLVDVDSALPQLELLMANLDKLPTRYRSIAQSLYADLKQNQADPLSEVAKLMSDAGRRQSLERTSPKVLEQEEEIVKALDKIIKDLEQQRKQMRSASNSQGGPADPDQKSSPAEASPGGSASPPAGDVDSKPDDQNGNWGDLDDEAKAIAVKNLVRDLPPHFQSLMKAYFQKLAEDKK